MSGEVSRADEPSTRSPAPVNRRAPAEIVAVYFDRKHDIKVKRGENGGQTLSYHNVVRKMAPVAVWQGEAKTIPIALPKGNGAGEACAVIVQMQATRRIVGAAKLPLAGS